MREIEFRGLDPKSGELVKGDLIHGVGDKCGKVFILPIRVNLAYVKNCDPLDGVEVDPKTVGQFTGLLDKNGKKIFEGDVVNINEVERKYVVKFHNGCFKLFHADPKLNGMLWGNVERVSELLWNLEIIGNVTENPELLK